MYYIVTFKVNSKREKENFIYPVLKCVTTFTIIANTSQFVHM